MKNIFKFILKLAIAAVVVVAVVFGINAITTPNQSATDITNLVAQNKTVQNWQNASLNIYSITTQNNSHYSGTNKASETVIKNIEKVDEILIEYFDYYINLTCFENKTDSSLKSKLTKQINELNAKIADTQKYLNNVNSASSTAYQEINTRIVKMFEAHCKQIQSMFDVCNTLQQYVYKVNYNQTSCHNKTEAVLEMMKDYSKVIFEKCINNNIYGTNDLSLLNESAETSFSSAYTKFVQMSNSNNNSDIETSFEISYFQINSQFLNQYFGLNSTNKTNYVGNTDNFVAEAPEGESALDAQIRYQEGRNQQINIQYLNMFLSCGSF